MDVVNQDEIACDTKSYAVESPQLPWLRFVHLIVNVQDDGHDLTIVDGLLLDCSIDMLQLL